MSRTRVTVGLLALLAVAVPACDSDDAAPRFAPGTPSAACGSAASPVESCPGEPAASVCGDAATIDVHSLLADMVDLERRRGKG
jgi:hypothetical protein